MANGKLTNPQTAEESVDVLQSLLAEIIPGWTDSYGGRDKSRANILDSLLYDATGGHPPYIQLFREDEWADYVKQQSGSGQGVDPKGIRKWWGAEADTGKKTRHSDPSEVTPDTLRIRNLSNLITEIPHLLQYRDPNWLKPKEDYSWAFSDKDWEKKYTTQGEFEYEAHSIIEPLIRNLFSKAIPEDYIWFTKMYKELQRENLLESRNFKEQRNIKLNKRRKRNQAYGADRLFSDLVTQIPDFQEEYKKAQLPRRGGGTQGPVLSDWLEENYPELNLREIYKLFEQQKLHEESVPQNTTTRTYYH